MKIQPGDKVKFLNEKGGGIVTRIIDGSVVEVSIEEVENADHSEKLFDVNYDVKTRIEKPVEQPRETGIQDAEAAGKISSGVYFALSPCDQKILISGLVDVMIINHTGYDLLYNLFRKTSKGFSGADYGSIGPEASAVIATVDHETLNNWTDGLIQLMFHSSNETTVISPAEQAYRIKGSKLLKEDNYTQTPFLHGRVCVIPLHTLVSGEQEKEVRTLKIISRPDHSLIEKHRTGDGTAEVDLHIFALVDDTSRLNAAQIMDIQLDYVKRCLESAIAGGYENIVFIHGVGAGILKIELRKIFEAYDFIEFFDAPIAKYGIGATELIIHKRQ